MIPIFLRTFLVTGHDLYCRPWIVPVMTILGALAFFLASILAYPRVT